MVKVLFKNRGDVKNWIFYITHSLSINLSTSWQTRKKEGKSVQSKLVGVQGYGRDCFGRKQAETGYKSQFIASFYQFYNTSSELLRNPPSPLCRVSLRTINECLPSPQPDKEVLSWKSPFCQISVLKNVHIRQDYVHFLPWTLYKNFDFRMQSSFEYQIFIFRQRIKSP